MIDTKVLMPLTLTDIFDRLRSIDEISLLEVLGITSEDLVDRFADRIEDNADALELELEEEEDENV